MYIVNMRSLRVTTRILRSWQEDHMIIRVWIVGLSLERWMDWSIRKKKHRVLMTVETWLPGAEVNYVSIGGDEIRAQNQNCAVNFDDSKWWVCNKRLVDVRVVSQPDVPISTKPEWSYGLLVSYANRSRNSAHTLTIENGQGVTSTTTFGWEKAEGWNPIHIDAYAFFIAIWKSCQTCWAFDYGL